MKSHLCCNKNETEFYEKKVGCLKHHEFSTINVLYATKRRINMTKVRIKNHAPISIMTIAG